MNHVLPRHRTPDAAVSPARDVRLVLIFTPTAWRSSGVLPAGREMEDELVAVVEEPSAVDWLVVATARSSVEPGARAGQRLLDRDRLDPVNRVLQAAGAAAPPAPRRVPSTGSVGLAPDVQEQRAVAATSAPAAAAPSRRSTRDTPIARHRVVVGAVADAEVVGRRRDDDVDAAGREASEHVECSRRDRSEAWRPGRERGVRMGANEAPPGL